MGILFLFPAGPEGQQDRYQLPRGAPPPRAHGRGSRPLSAVDGLGIWLLRGALLSPVLFYTGGDLEYAIPLLTGSVLGALVTDLVLNRRRARRKF